MSLEGIDRRAWFMSTDERFRSAFITHHAAQHAVEVHGNPNSPSLTPYGIASSAAAAAMVLAMPDHPNHERVAAEAMVRAEREARSDES